MEFRLARNRGDGRSPQHESRVIARLFRLSEILFRFLHQLVVNAERRKPGYLERLPDTTRLFSSHLELPGVESAAMRTRIYPWIILTIALSIVILYAPSDLYKYARKEARTAIVKLQLKLDRMRMRYGPPAAM